MKRTELRKMIAEQLNEDALGDFARSYDTARTLVSKLTKEMAAMVKEQKADPKNYSIVGSMNHVVEELKDIMEFLTGNR